MVASNYRHRASGRRLTGGTDGEDAAWFTRWHDAYDIPGRFTLVCVPHAGAGASVYARWAALLPPWIDLLGVTLPGREKQSKQSPLTCMDEVTGRLGPALARHVTEPFVIFGHSLGALIAYELAHWLERRSGPRPEVVIVSGRAAPHRPRQHLSLQELDDGEFLTALHDRYGGVPKVLRESPSLWELFLPSMRGDMSILEGYQFKERLLGGPDLFVLGAEDDPTTNLADLYAWSEVSRGHVRVTVLPDGGHFYPQSRADQVTALLVDELVARSTPW